MKKHIAKWILALIVSVSVSVSASASVVADDALQSWNESASKQAIVDFVARVTAEDSADFVEPAQRIAVFDNDGTLWSEQPLYFQVIFALDRAKQLAEAEPGFASSPVLKAAATGDIEGLVSAGKEGLLELVNATHSGVSVDDFQAAVADWLASARHPKTGMAYDAMIYQPMVELLDYLRANDFAVYIVSGGGIDFMRVFAEDAYGVPPENVIGSMGELGLEVVDGEPVVVKQPGIAFIDDKEGKPVGIARHIGQRPIFVGGNSDGDLAMAQWSTAGDGARFALFVRHTDAEREFQYDREGPVGKFDQALDEADAKGWTVVDMANDWAVVYPETN